MEEMEGGREVDEGQGRRKGGGVSVVVVGGRRVTGNKVEKPEWERGGISEAARTGLNKRHSCIFL